MTPVYIFVNAIVLHNTYTCRRFKSVFSWMQSYCTICTRVGNLKLHREGSNRGIITPKDEVNSTRIWPPLYSRSALLQRTDEYKEASQTALKADVAEPPTWTKVGARDDNPICNHTQLQSTLSYNQHPSTINDQVHQNSYTTFVKHYFIKK